MRFFIGDTHFYHENIIKYCDRPFKTVEQMNAQLITNWNKVVSPADTVIHLGDFAFGKGKYTKELLKQLNGKKALIRGNHDESAKKMYEYGFDFVVETAKIHLDGWGQVVLSHYPIEPFSKIMEEIGCVGQIHGHQHNASPLFVNKHRVNVSCENLDYTPISEFQLVQRWQDFVINAK